MVKSKTWPWLKSSGKALCRRNGKETGNSQGASLDLPAPPAQLGDSSCFCFCSHYEALAWNEQQQSSRFDFLGDGIPGVHQDTQPNALLFFLPSCRMNPVQPGDRTMFNQVSLTYVLCLFLPYIVRAKGFDEEETRTGRPLEMLI